MLDQPHSPAPTLDDEIARLATQRDRLQQWLHTCLASGQCSRAEMMRDLTALARISGRLGALVARRPEGTSQEKSFLALVARLVREGAADESDDPPTGAAPGPRSTALP